MAVKETKQSQQDLDQENKDVDSIKRDATNAILSTLDLPETEPKKERVEKVGPKEEPKKEPKKEPETEDEEFESDKTDEEILEAKDSDLDEKELLYKKQLLEDKDEDLIPKSKFEKTIKKMQQRIDKLTAESHKEKPSTTTDSDVVRLENMSTEKLDSTKKSIKREIRETTRRMARGEDIDEKRLDDLEDLSDKVDDAARTYSTRFHKKQVSLFNEAAEEIANDPEIDNIDEVASEIKKIAEGIYSEYPKLSTSEEGQAMALKLAADHWKMKQTFSVSKSKVDTLRKSHKRLLRKTTLDSNTVRGSVQKTGLKALREKAGQGSTLADKTAFVKASPEFNIDALIPDEFKEK